MAFGNRTEILLTAPIFIYLLTINKREATGETDADVPILQRIRDYWRSIAAFCAVPFVLGVATLAYNQARFHALGDFGYARIPGVLNEPWYNHGIFSAYYIPRQAYEMLWKPWNVRAAFPYLVPDGFSSSIIWSSPFLLFALRPGSRDRTLKYLSWAAVAVLTLVLWMHGNSGGWQFGYRYAMVLLPWLFVILLESSPKKLSLLEWLAIGFSLLANLYATILFHWTDVMRG